VLYSKSDGRCSYNFDVSIVDHSDIAETDEEEQDEKEDDDNESLGVKDQDFLSVLVNQFFGLKARRQVVVLLGAVLEEF
jgi:hypothetical protein